jgi:hypothetical protein
VQATTTGNYIEMGLALASIPVDMAAQSYAIKHGKQAAAQLNMASATISLLNKIFFFYNNFYNTTYVSRTSYGIKRDCIANGIIAIRDITKIIQAIKKIPVSHNDPSFTADLSSLLDDEQITQFMEQVNNNNQLPDNQVNEKHEDTQAKEVSKATYLWKVGVLPLAKGLTAFLIAWTQDGTHSFSGEHACFVATAAHSLARLLDEYSALDVGSPYRKAILVLLLANIAWLIFEIKSYRDTLPPEWHPGPVAHEGECGICLDTSADFQAAGKGNDFRELQCGHVYCKHCLRQHVDAQLKDNNFANLHCPHQGCMHLINEAEIRNIVDNNMTLLSNYNDAAFKDWQTRARLHGWRQCPTPNCGYGFINDENRRIAHECPSCHQRYCGNCLTNHDSNAACPVTAITAGSSENADWIRRNTKPCPRCSVAIQKNEGCNHMTCQRAAGGCGHEFCWICGQPWNRNTHPSFYQCPNGSHPNNDASAGNAQVPRRNGPPTHTSLFPWLLDD